MAAMCAYMLTECFIRGWVWGWRMLQNAGHDTRWMGDPFILLPVTAIAACGSLGMVYFMSREGERLWVIAGLTALLAGILSYLV